MLRIGSAPRTALLAVLAVLAVLACSLAGCQPQGEPSRPSDIVTPPRAGDVGLADGQASIVIARDHFKLTIDESRGGEITDLQLWDGAAWSRVLGGDGHSFPAITLSANETDFALARAGRAHVEILSHTSEVDTIRTVAVPRAANGCESAWQIVLDFEIHRAGAIFVGIEARLASGTSTLASVDVALDVGSDVLLAPRYREEITTSSPALPSARVAFGAAPMARGMTNEIEIMVEDATALSGASRFTTSRGHFAWRLADGGSELRAPFVYRNRIALGLGATATGAPRTNLVGQRPYHWVARDPLRASGRAWYPTDAEIDRMAGAGATMLVLHNFWMAEGGSNGLPHADYARPRDATELRRAIQRAHDRRMRIGLYSRGIERYGVDTGFFETYLQRDWDGLYVDWHGAHASASHERAHVAEPALGDVHASTDGHVLPARDYFLYIQRLREVVGVRGFIIGHQGSFASGVLANLGVDAYLMGEASPDHDMLKSANEATYRGMMGGGVAMPWTVDAPATFMSREGIAKMAAWGIYPDVPLGIYAFPSMPSDSNNQYAASYWRLLAAGKAEEATVYNTPAMAVVAAISSNTSIACVVYKRVVAGGAPELMVIAANVSGAPSSATLTLLPSVLGVSGAYRVSRVDPATGSLTAAGTTTAAIDTGPLAAWDLAGWKLTR